MKKVLITGGTIFVSKYIATHFAAKSNTEVYVLNRNNHPQVEGVKLIQCDKNNIGNALKNYSFDAVIAVNTYTGSEMKALIDALDKINDFIFISSSAVYPESLPQPFCEDMEVGVNSVWGDYGTNKIDAENLLLSQVPQAYILRPPYLYGSMQNLYREGFVFDCAMQNRPFCIPKDGKMNLQFFHVKDLCRFIDILLSTHPNQHIFNVGNKESVDINTFVQECYNVVGAELEKIYVSEIHTQRSFFPFHDYDYRLDVSKMCELMPTTMPLSDGLRDSFLWYKNNMQSVNRKNYIEYIDKNIL